VTLDRGRHNLILSDSFQPSFEVSKVRVAEKGYEVMKAAVARERKRIIVSKQSKHSLNGDSQRAVVRLTK